MHIAAYIINNTRSSGFCTRIIITVVISSLLFEIINDNREHSTDENNIRRTDFLPICLYGNSEFYVSTHF